MLKICKKFFWGATFLSYLAGFLSIYCIMFLSTHLWFRWDTRVTNHLPETIELSAVARNEHGDLFVLFKNGWFPTSPSHSYEAIILKPGQTANLIWDWDDQTLNGFRIKLASGALFFQQIDSRKASACCYPSDLEYSIDAKSIVEPSPKGIETLSTFKREDRWLSYLVPALFTAFFWSMLFYPATLLFRWAFLSQRGGYAAANVPGP